jgi:hypothetical protein
MRLIPLIPKFPKMKNKYFKHLFYFLAIILLFSSCKKSKYLDRSPNESLVIPQTLSDFQALLDNDQYMNGTNRLGNGVVPRFEFIGSDDYYTVSNLSTISLSNQYIWNDDIYSSPITDWSFIYKCVFYANEALDGLHALSASTDDLQKYNNIKGSALFYRSFAFYHAAQVYAPPFDNNTADNDYGICLKLTSDINEKISRSSVRSSYNRIIDDVKQSISLLPVTPLYKTRPSKPAAYALLAEVYLSMRDYNNALLYSDSCLQLEKSLIDYNSISHVVNSTAKPFIRFNPEVLFQALINSSTLMSTSTANVDSILYSAYDPNDLRKTLFYVSGTVFSKPGYLYIRSYDGSTSLFGGLATDQTYLTRAECYARTGNVTGAMNDLNTLLIKRWKAGTFTSLTASSQTDALNKVLIERRKELVFRGTRWTDLRRLNKEGANITITRKFNGQTYSLSPNSLFYTYLIPPDVMSFNLAMPQNLR